MEMDKVLCSNRCPCKRLEDKIILDYKKKYSLKINETWIFNETSVVTDFIGCPISVQLYAYNNTLKNIKLKYFNSFYSYKFPTISFYKYWKEIENKFNCVGLCDKVVSDSKVFNTTIYKYLFKGVNKYK